MKNLLWFLLPIGAWIGTGFLWSYSGPFVDNMPEAWGFWFLITDILAIGADIFLFLAAIVLSGLDKK